MPPGHRLKPSLPRLVGRSTRPWGRLHTAPCPSIGVVDARRAGHAPTVVVAPSSASITASTTIPRTAGSARRVISNRTVTHSCANTNRFLKTCIIESSVSVDVARRAAELRRLARKGSAVDALVVAIAEPGGTVLTGDRADIEALAAHADRVGVDVV